MSDDKAVKDDLFPFVWQEYLPGRRKDVELAPRRQRPSAPEIRPFQSLTEKQLKRRLNHRSVLSRLAVATEVGRRPDSTQLLIELLRVRCPSVRFAAERALGQRKVRDAVPGLLGGPSQQP